MLSLAKFVGSRDPTYDLLPSTSSSSSSLHSESPRPARHPLSGRPLRRIALLFVFLLIGAVGTRSLLHRRHGSPVMRRPKGMPPSYDDIREYERALPQHDKTLPWPEGIDGRYVKFETPYHDIGFNNQLQDIIMASQLAYMSNRAYAFQPYVHNMESMGQVIRENGHYISADIPLNAFLDAPSSGARMGPGSGRTLIGGVARWEAPRSVSWEWYEEVCPKWRRKYVETQEIRERMNLPEKEGGATGREILDGFSKVLMELNETCVSVSGDHIFTFRIFGPPIADAFEVMQDSPVLTKFRWSPLVRGIVARNLPLLIDTHRFLGARLTRWFLDPAKTVPEEFPGLLAVHLRRGDFIGHCGALYHWNASYNGWNTFPKFTDRFPLDPHSIPEGAEKFEMYMEHCLPAVEQVVARMMTVKQQWEAGSTQSAPRKLKRAYFLTNAEEEFRGEVKRRLLEAGWEHVAMSQDLLVSDDEIEVDMAADMMIGQLAEVFVGNGFSSLTSNINLLRMGRKVDTDSIRFW